jgi:hypothetical protein
MHIEINPFGRTPFIHKKGIAYYAKKRQPTVLLKLLLITHKISIFSRMHFYQTTDETWACASTLGLVFHVE